VVDKYTFIVRPAMMHLSDHPLDDRLRRLKLDHAHNTANSAHGVMPI
jgi:hypothetical protein